MLFHYTLAWFPMAVIAIANGTVRDYTYGKRVSDLRGHQISTITGIACLGIYILALTRWIWPIGSSSQAWTIGLIWLGLTLAFEFGFGRYVMGHPWTRLLHDYNLFAGRVWILVLLWITVAPYLFYLVGEKIYRILLTDFRM